MTMPKLGKLDLDMLNFPTECVRNVALRDHSPTLYSEESPSTEASTLPQLTPGPPAQDVTWIQVHRSEWNADRDRIRTPLAPEIKDMESFSQGTGVGSFEDLLDAGPIDGDLFYHPPENSGSLGLLPEFDSDVSLSIKTWREEVYANAPPSVQIGVTDLPEDDIDREALDAANSLSGIKLEHQDQEAAAADDGLSMEHCIPTPTSMIASTAPRVTKRARSRTPDESRRTRPRPRSQSLSSIQSFSHNYDDFSSAPWRPKSVREDYRPPFD
ncbi:hypothetical protein Hypma_002157 [Hypsizygus marmoreus]|uniref:Uncharacterized protein n=1 Tax=Hypsizygus marmoreus TaxID=39966 RepID=A0A369K4U9_HYPMA|nr:hypothetical protein Hypma_002157 [Hypsizygus marmoreus]